MEALREVAASNADGPARSDVDELARRISTLEGRHDGYDVFIGTLAVIAVTIAAVALGVAVHVLHRPTASAVAAPRTAATSAHVDVTVSDYRVDVPNRLSPGKVRLRIHNAAKQAHELLVFHTSEQPEAWPRDATGRVIEDAPGLNKISDGDDIAPGATQTRTVDLSTPGTYVFVCNLPGHFANGMHEVVTVG